MGNAKLITQTIEDIASDLGKVRPLDIHEIDHLCEKLNSC